MRLSEKELAEYRKKAQSPEVKEFLKKVRDVMGTYQYNPSDINLKEISKMRGAAHAKAQKSAEKLFYEVDRYLVPELRTADPGFYNLLENIKKAMLKIATYKTK